jgi:hypothetical protein
VVLNIIKFIHNYIETSLERLVELKIPDTLVVLYITIASYAIVFVLMAISLYETHH